MVQQITQMFNKTIKLFIYSFIILLLEIEEIDKICRSFFSHIPRFNSDYLRNEPIRRLLSDANADPSFL